MNISTRITEYSITGGLLWVNIFLFTTLINMKIDHLSVGNVVLVWSDWLDAFTPLKSTLETALPSALQGSLGTLLGALMIIVIFFSGILLDLNAPVCFGPCELYFFRKWLVKKNRVWLDRLIGGHREFIETDYCAIIDGRVLDWKHPLAWFEQRRCFHKISAFLLSHVMVFSQAAALEELMDRMHLWRTSRAISTSMVVLAVLLTFITLAPFSEGQEHAPGLWLIATVIPILLTLLSAVITLGTYSRMCLFLGSLAYPTTQRENGGGAARCRGAVRAAGSRILIRRTSALGDARCHGLWFRYQRYGGEHATGMGGAGVGAHGRRGGADRGTRPPSRLVAVHNWLRAVAHRHYRRAVQSTAAGVGAVARTHTAAARARLAGPAAGAAGGGAAFVVALHGDSSAGDSRYQHRYGNAAVLRRGAAAASGRAQPGRVRRRRGRRAAAPSLPRHRSFAHGVTAHRRLCARARRRAADGLADRRGRTAARPHRGHRHHTAVRLQG